MHRESCGNPHTKLMAMVTSAGGRYALGSES